MDLQSQFSITNDKKDQANEPPEDTLRLWTESLNGIAEGVVI
jgi:hypothetical protein